MLSINLTLFAQVINFLIAWFLLDRCLLQVGYAFIMQKRLLKKNIEDQHRQLQEHLELKNQWYRSVQSAHARALYAAIPQLESASFRQVQRKDFPPSDLSVQEKHVLIDAYKERIEHSLLKDIV